MKQLEKAGIPATHICTVTPISKTVGAARIFGAQAIPYPTGDPNLPPEKEMNRRREIVMGALNLLTYILRPANFSPRTPGRGVGIYDCGRFRIRVISLIGRCDLSWGSDNPFTTADRLLAEPDAPTFTVVDFHAQATSEKLAMAYYLDGRVSALWGTHTHVPTADERVFPKGTGYLTDLGMTGAVESVLGIQPQQSVEMFLGGLPGRFRPASGPCKAQGALFTLDSATGLCTAVERVDIR